MTDECLWEVLWRFVRVAFQARWANPAWELAALDLRTEEHQIRTKIEGIVDQQLGLLFSTPATPPGQNVVARNVFKRWWRKSRMKLRSMVDGS